MSVSSARLGKEILDETESTPPEPNTSDDYLVTKFAYDPSLTDVRMIVDRIDNAGRTVEMQDDLFGRTIANYVDGTVVETDTDSDVTIKYHYDAFGRLATLTAVNGESQGRHGKLTADGPLRRQQPARVAGRDRLDLESG